MTDDTLQNQLDAAHDRVADLESAVSMSLHSWDHDELCETRRDDESCNCWRGGLAAVYRADPTPTVPDVDPRTTEQIIAQTVGRVLLSRQSVTAVGSAVTGALRAAGRLRDTTPTGDTAELGALITKLEDSLYNGANPTGGAYAWALIKDHIEASEAARANLEAALTAIRDGDGRAQDRETARDALAGDLVVLREHDAKVRGEVLAAIRAEIHHAHDNGHILDRDCQGVAPGARVPAVRVSSLMAVVERFEKGQSS